VEKEAGGRLSRIVTKMVSRPLIDRVLKDEKGYIDEQIYIDYLVVIIAQMAEDGNVVFLDRGSQYILNDFPEAFHILLINTFANRIKFMMNNYDLSQNRATHIVKTEEKRRMNLYRKIGKQDYDQPELYHLVINMARVDLEEAIQLILHLVQRKSG
jgi:cytidylate kinase